MKTNRNMAAAVIASVAVLAGCASSPSYNDPGAARYPASQQPAYNAAYGVIDSIQIVQQEVDSRGVGGAIIGGVVGGVLGNQVGKGSGRAVATTAGAVGGAVVGNNIQKSRQGVREAYQINIRGDNGGYFSVVQESVADLRVGDRVRVENNRVYRY
ncbi:lipoprotein [Oxalicibacterium flavum]|uniref:Lipoprotein n=1 Tax=Oxalicibacterium flavum TaxID=179467 RepID=A0A8J2UMV7_9BURK|nr:glycine zipper 2TM domain-containing protein [Oxalicibacterium flavum]GGB95867.1 lipoprotein [Oxalicibacterium flavum]